MNIQGLDRITLDPNIICGKPTIRNTRVIAGTIVWLLASGCSVEEILESYPYLERDDIQQSLAFAAWRLSEESDVPLQQASRRRMHARKRLTVDCAPNAYQHWSS